MIRLMSHMVAHYPDAENAMAVAEGLVEGGSDYLEIQFPFSDPTADGPVIQAACQHALEAGFTVDKGFEFVAEVRRRFEVPIFIMTYASLVVARGVDTFLDLGSRAGATGFILPDLPPDYDEGSYDAAEKAGAVIMPVLVTTMKPERVAFLRNRNMGYLYVALRQGITGSQTDIGADNLAFLDQIAGSGTRVMAGFGITENAQVRALDGHVDAAIVGSALVRTVTEVSEKHGAAPTLGRELTAALREQVLGLRGEMPRP